MPKIFVGNLAYASSNVDLQRWVESHGFNVESAEVIYERSSGRSRGFGFVTLAEGTDIQGAITALSGRRLDGRVLVVNKATPLPMLSTHYAGHRKVESR